MLVDGGPGVAVWLAGGVVCVKGAGCLEEAEERALDGSHNGPAGLVHFGEEGVCYAA